MTQKHLDRLKEVRDFLTDEYMRKCHFGGKTEEIVQATKVWRDSWILGPLDEIIAHYEVEVLRRKRKR